MFHRTIAAALVGAALFAVPAQAGELKPYQKAALEKMLEQVEPKMRDMARPQIEQMLAPLSEAQVKMMMAAMAQNMSQQQAAQEDEQKPDEDTGPNPADIAYNEAQVKPAIRTYYDARRAFDAYVEKKNEELRHYKDYGVFGHGWGFHLSPLEIKDDQQAGENYPLFEQTFISYVPQDGRYRFDFSKIKTGFNAVAIDRIVAAALQEYDRIGETFVSEGKKMDGRKDYDGMHTYYQRMNGKVFALIERMNQQIAAEAPSDGAAFGKLILTGERVD